MAATRPTLRQLDGGKYITQTGHGLAVGDVIRHNGYIYVKARANSVANAEVVGVVDVVRDANNFEFALPGELVETLSGLTPGSVSFLSASTAGLATESDAADGEVSKPVWLAISETSAVVLNSRGVYKVAGTDPSTEVINEPPAGELDGDNDEFTLEFTPEANSLQLYLNGVLREVDTDYTLSGVTITFLTAPVNGSILLATYVKA